MFFFLGITESNSSTQSVPGEALAVGRSDASSTSSSRLREHSKSKQNHKLGVLASKFFDEKIPLKKKVWYINTILTHAFAILNHAHVAYFCYEFHDLGR
jgi:hypothetical protein